MNTLEYGKLCEVFTKVNTDPNAKPWAKSSHSLSPSNILLCHEHYETAIQDHRKPSKNVRNKESIHLK